MVELVERALLNSSKAGDPVDAAGQPVASG